jgi:hypothetical protein
MYPEDFVRSASVCNGTGWTVGPRRREIAQCNTPTAGFRSCFRLVRRIHPQLSPVWRASLVVDKIHVENTAASQVSEVRGSWILSALSGLEHLAFSRAFGTDVFMAPNYQAAVKFETGHARRPDDADLSQLDPRTACPFSFNCQVYV